MGKKNKHKDDFYIPGIYQDEKIGLVGKIILALGSSALVLIVLITLVFTSLALFFIFLQYVVLGLIILFL